MNTRLIRFPEVHRITGLARSTLFKKERAGQFPRRRKVGANSVAWLLDEVEEWCRTREVVAVGQGNEASSDEG